MYQCKRCGYATERKTNLTRHLQAQRVCTATLSSVDRGELLQEVQRGGNQLQSRCGTCDAVFATRAGRWKHAKACAGCPEVSGLHALIQTIESLRLEVEELRNHGTHNNTISGGSNNTINDNRTVLTVNQYTKVDTGVIQKDEMVDILAKRTFNHLYDSLKEVIRIVYYNEKHPENHAVFIPNVREKYAKVYDGHAWVYKDKGEVVTSMRNVGVELMRDFFYDHESEFSMIQKQMLTKWDKSYAEDDNRPFDKKTKQAVVETIMSHQELVKQTIDRYNLL